MSILDTLEKDIKYSLVELNSEIKRKIFEEAYGDAIPESTIDYYVEGKGVNTPLCLYYSNVSLRWYCSTLNATECNTPLLGSFLGKTFKHKSRIILVV